MNTISKIIQEMGVVPVVVLNDAKDAKPLAQALCEGGLPCAEVTFRTEAAEESIRLMTECYPDMFVGAGTVLTTEQVDRAVNAAPYVGVKFMPTGGVNAKNLDSYLSCDKIVACGGSWMVKGDLVAEGKFDEIKSLVEEAVELVAKIRGK